MDFCQLLHKAKKNDQTGPNGARYYSTKFEPPKKIKKETKELSENIKKFLAKKEAEEKAKQLENQRKKEELLALRSQDKKATRRVNVMLKRTKSANQSVLDDAVDKTHTAVTRAGPEQPDEDDYGYVSQEASALYEKMMEKYSQLPEERKFDPFKKKVSTNLGNTKDRVKAALEKEKEDALLPRKRKRKHHDEEKEEEKPCKSEKNSSGDAAKPKPKPRPSGPPPMSFEDLLKVAAKKQHEPIMIEEKPKEDEKLYTKKQKKELEREREWRDKRERRHEVEPQKVAPGEPKKSEKQLSSSKPTASSNSIANKEKVASKPPKLPMKTNGTQKSSSNAPINGIRKEDPKRSQIASKFNNNNNNNNNINAKSKESMQKVKPKEFPPKDLKPKQFPPPDVRGIKRSKPLVPNRGRIIDDDEDEYDSELDDFIDDGPEEGDYSSYIKEIFGYDKSRYKGMDEDVDNMESTFAQQMKEEVISAKIGIMEDLEDIKKEEEEKRRKALMKKKMRH